MTPNNHDRWFDRPTTRRLMKAALAVSAAAMVAFAAISAATRLNGALGTLTASAMSAAQARTAHANPTSSAVDPAVRKLADEYLKAFLAADARAVASTFVEDGVELPNNAPPVKGRAAIEQRYRAFFAGPVKITGFTLSPTDTVINGDLAYDVGSYEQRISLPGGQVVTEMGKYFVLLKRARGQWKIAYSIYNTDAERKGGALLGPRFR